MKPQTLKTTMVKKAIIIMLYMFQLTVDSFAQCDEEYIPGNMVSAPSKEYYCIGDNVQFTFNATGTAYPLWAQHWSYSGTAAGTNTASNTMTLTGLITQGVITFSAYYVNSNNDECPFTFTLAINMSYLQVTATSPIAVVAMSQIGIGCTPSGGFTPYTYNWYPNAFFTGGTSNTSQNPNVTTPSSIIYTVTVTDEKGCVDQATVELIAPPYAHTVKIPDGGYYNLTLNKLLFKYDGQYATQSSISCKFYDKANSPTTPSILPISSVSPGDNRYFLDASSLAAGYYTLELINEKKEKEYLRFKK